MATQESEANIVSGAWIEILRVGQGVLRAYSNILFVDSPLIGLAFLIATFWFPNVGLAGLIGAVIGMAVGYSLRLPYATSGVNVYSSLLVGLSLGAYYEVDANLTVLIVLSAALTVLLAASLRDVLWRLGHLPVLSVPFVIVALTTALAASSYTRLSLYLEPSALPPEIFGNWLDIFFATLGSVYFSPNPLVGTLLFAGILLQSRYLAFLCIAGFASGEYVFVAMAVDPSPGLVAWTGFNFALTAMAVGRNPSADSSSDKLCCSSSEKPGSTRLSNGGVNPTAIVKCPRTANFDTTSANPGSSCSGAKSGSL